MFILFCRRSGRQGFRPKGRERGGLGFRRCEHDKTVHVFGKHAVEVGRVFCLLVPQFSFGALMSDRDPVMSCRVLLFPLLFVLGLFLSCPALSCLPCLLCFLSLLLELSVSSAGVDARTRRCGLCRRGVSLR